MLCLWEIIIFLKPHFSPLPPPFPSSFKLECKTRIKSSNLISFSKLIKTWRRSTPRHLHRFPHLRHLFIRSSVHLFSCSSVHVLIKSSVHLFNHSCVHFFIKSSVHLFNCSYVHLFMCPSVHLLTCWCVCLFIFSLVHLLICLSIYLCISGYALLQVIVIGPELGPPGAYIFPLDHQGFDK